MSDIETAQAELHDIMTNKANPKHDGYWRGDSVVLVHINTFYQKAPRTGSGAVINPNLDGQHPNLAGVEALSPAAPRQDKAGGESAQGTTPAGTVSEADARASKAFWKARGETSQDARDANYGLSYLQADRGAFADDDMVLSAREAGISIEQIQQALINFGRRARNF